MPMVVRLETESRLGTLAILAVSLAPACARAAALLSGDSLYRFLDGVVAIILRTDDEYLNGSAAANTVDVQEFDYRQLLF